MLSVVIPVKNMEEYIGKCIESLVSYDGGEMEIIVVDFGSTDETVSMVRGLAKRYKNIRLNLDLEGVTDVCAARNAGLKLARYDFVAFIDADDYSDKNYYFKIADIMRKRKMDIGFSDYKNVLEGGRGEVYATKYDAVRIPSGRDDLVSLVATNSINCEVWNKVYSREFLEKNEMYFDGEKGASGEDLLFNIICLCETNKICYGKAGFYYHLKRNGSLGKTRANLTDRYIHIVKFLENSEFYPIIKNSLPLVFANLMMQDLKRKSANEIKKCYNKYRSMPNFNLYLVKNVFTFKNTLKRKIVCVLFLLRLHKIALGKIIKNEEV